MVWALAKGGASMDQKDIRYIEGRLDAIVGVDEVKIGRGAGMVWLSFPGEKSYALHIDGWFRIVEGNKVIVGKADIFLPTQEVLDVQGFSWSEFNWDQKGNNRFDYWAERFNEMKVAVKQVEVSVLGDLTLYFNNNYVLQILIDTSSKEESWRFFERHGKSHLVVTGQGIDE